MKKFAMGLLAVLALLGVNAAASEWLTDRWFVNFAQHIRKSGMKALRNAKPRCTTHKRRRSDAVKVLAEAWRTRDCGGAKKENG